MTRLARTHRSQGHRAAGRPRAGAPQRPRRGRQSQPDLRPRRPAISGSTPPTPARCSRSRCATMPRSSRFDVTFEIANEDGTAPTKLRFTGTAIETVEAAVLARNVERNEVLKSSDVVVERRPKAEVGTDAAAPRPRGRHAGAPAAARRPGAAGRRSRQARSGAARPERHADLRVRRALSHHARQGAGRRHRRRRRQRH